MAIYGIPCMWNFKFFMIPRGLVILWFAILRWYGTNLGLGKPNFVMRFSIIMFTLALLVIKTSSTTFFPTYKWITTIWLSTFIIVEFSSKCVSTTISTTNVSASNDASNGWWWSCSWHSICFPSCIENFKHLKKLSFIDHI